MSLSETPEEFWYKNIAKYSNTIDSDSIFPSNVVLSTLVKTRCTDICLFKGHLKNGDNMILTYPRNASIDGSLVIKNFIGVGVGQCEYVSESNVNIYPLDYNKPMDDVFFFDLLEKSYGWEIKDYGDLSIY